MSLPLLPPAFRWTRGASALAGPRPALGSSRVRLEGSASEVVARRIVAERGRGAEPS